MVSDGIREGCGGGAGGGESDCYQAYFQAVLQKSGSAQDSFSKRPNSGMFGDDAKYDIGLYP
jgi:hypothetical protein